MPEQIYTSVFGAMLLLSDSSNKVTENSKRSA